VRMRIFRSPCCWAVATAQVQVQCSSLHSTEKLAASVPVKWPQTVRQFNAE
jgi:hypothetical protein